MLERRHRDVHPRRRRPGAPSQRFGEEVAPALREAVAAERARTAAPTTGSRPRRTIALAKRRAGIDYDALPASLAATAVEPGDREYGARALDLHRGGSPGLVLRPRTPQSVGDARGVRPRRRTVPLAVRSGGHGISGRSTNDGGIVIDVGALDAVEVLDRERRLVRLGAGARWGDVAAALAPHGLAISSGDYGDVGVGGLATAGGIGFLARCTASRSTTCVAAELVLADGRIVRADADHEPDLFWAVRGAGANFGIVTAVEIEAAEVGDVVYATIVFDATDTAPFSSAGARWSRTRRGELTSFLTLVPAARAEPRDRLRDHRVGRRRTRVGDRRAGAVPRHRSRARAAGPAGAVRRDGRSRRTASTSAARTRRRPRRAGGARHARARRRSSVDLVAAATPTCSSSAPSAAPSTTWTRTPPRTRTGRRTSPCSPPSAAVGGRRSTRGGSGSRPHLDGVYLSFETEPVAPSGWPRRSRRGRWPASPAQGRLRPRARVRRQLRRRAARRRAAVPR